MPHTGLLIRVLEHTQEGRCYRPHSTGQETGTRGSLVFIAMAAITAYYLCKAHQQQKRKSAWRLAGHHQAAIWVPPRFSRVGTAPPQSMRFTLQVAILPFSYISPFDEDTSHTRSRPTYLTSIEPGLFCKHLISKSPKVPER